MVRARVLERHRSWNRYISMEHSPWDHDKMVGTSTLELIRRGDGTFMFITSQWDIPSKIVLKPLIPPQRDQSMYLDITCALGRNYLLLAQEHIAIICS
jgi:hypothetical protein